MGFVVTNSSLDLSSLYVLCSHSRQFDVTLRELFLLNAALSTRNTCIQLLIKKQKTKFPGENRLFLIGKIKPTN